MKAILGMLCIALGMFASAARADSNVQLGMTFTEEGLRSFFLAIGDYYRVPQREITVIHERHVPYDEVPVVLFISRHAHVAPEVIVRMRLGGMSWMAITLHFHLSPVVYYIDVPGDIGPPYGMALGHFRNRPRHRWHEVRLSDGEIVDLVNLRVASEYHGYLPGQVARWRSAGRNYVYIYEQAGRAHREMGSPQLQRDRERDHSRARAYDYRRGEDGRAGPSHKGTREPGRGKENDRGHSGKPGRDD